MRLQKAKQRQYYLPPLDKKFLIFPNPVKERNHIAYTYILKVRVKKNVKQLGYEGINNLNHPSEQQKLVDQLNYK